MAPAVSRHRQAGGANAVTVSEQVVRIEALKGKLIPAASMSPSRATTAKRPMKRPTS
jgi:hypothetical protein